MPVLKFLKSTNRGGQRQICVTLVSDTSSVKGTLEFQVCNKTLSQSVCVPANNRATVCQTHESSGKCWVTVTLVNTDVTTNKFLDLDKSLDD